MAARRSKKSSGAGAPPAKPTESYRHPEAESLLRPDVGTQAQFRKKKPPKTYRYDSSLSPALDWDGDNPVRELGEWLLACVEDAATLPAPHEFETPRMMAWRGGTVEVRGLRDAVEQLRRLGRPFLDWAGKAERLSFDVPTLPLFVQERLSTKAILETLSGHKRDKQMELALFADPQHPIHDQVLRAYEYPDQWTNRMILGDSLVAMNSLLHYESLGGQVQMIYMDPPYGVEFGSNFQPFVRKRDVTHNDDEDMTREPEMVKAYRDTWELGLHSYLSYLRDRLLLCRDLLAPTGSIFVQISDQNVHYVRSVMDEVFGNSNHFVSIFVRKKGGQRGNEIKPVNDYLLWYGKDRERARSRLLFESKLDVAEIQDEFPFIEYPDGRIDTASVLDSHEIERCVEGGARLFYPEPLTSGGEFRTQLYTVEYAGKSFRPPPNNSWKFSEEGMRRIKDAGRLYVGRDQIRFKKYHTDFPYRALSNLWDDLAGATDKTYVVQTTAKVIQRCMHMTTEPGDLVVDPTCGSGTTAWVAEQWGRRWITIDTSRVPLALARQRLLTATFPFYALREPARGPAGGFVFSRKTSSRGGEIGGIVPHVTSTVIANNEIAAEEILPQRPDSDPSITRVTGPFCFEATIPTPVDFDADGVEDSGASTEQHGSFVDRMLEVLRKSPVLHLGGGKTVTFHNVRVPAKTLSLSAEAIVPTNGELRARDAGTDGAVYPIPVDEDVVGEPRRTIPGALVALVFGPESGAVSEKLVFEAAREAHAKSYAHLYVIGFAIQPNARELVEKCEAVVGVPATYVQATPDLMMGDLLKNMRSSQIFSVCGLPEVAIHAAEPEKKGDAPRYQVELVGLDVFDPVAMQTDHRPGNDVPAWLLDTDYNGLCFHVGQAFFPRTAAWDDLARSLRGQFDDAVWQHLAGTTSAPFEGGEHRQIAVKVIDDRGNELLVVKPLPKGNA